MKLFNTLLKIQTGKTDLQKSAVFIENSYFWWEWTYFIYHYDSLKNIFYINDLNYPWTENRTSAINIIEHIITKAYKQEMNSLSDILKILQINKKPKIIVSPFVKTKSKFLFIPTTMLPQVTLV